MGDVRSDLHVSPGMAHFICFLSIGFIPINTFMTQQIITILIVALAVFYSIQQLLKLIIIPKSKQSQGCTSGCSGCSLQEKKNHN